MDYFLKNMLLTMEKEDDFKSKFKFNDAEYKNVLEAYISKYGRVSFLGDDSAKKLSDQVIKTEIDRYNNSESLILLITNKSNTGLDLKGTNFIFIQDLVWTFTEFSQIKGRTGRIGSHENSDDKNVWTVVPALLRHEGKTSHY